MSGPAARVIRVTPDELRQRIARGENPHTEFKRALPANSELARQVVCFANSDGGQIIVGVADDGQVIGVADTDSLLLRIDQVAFDGCTPPVTVVPEILALDGRDVVVVHIPKGDERPYGTRDGRYYVRSGVRCRQAGRSELLRLFQAGEALYYDEQPLRRLALTELDLDAVARHVQDVGPTDDEDLARLLTAWRMFDGAHPTVGGLVVFGRKPQLHLESSGVVVGALAGDDLGGDFVDRKDLSGGLFDVLEQIEKFLGLHLRTGHKIVGFTAEQHPEIPPAALREATVNALVHRDYTVPAPIRIFVFADRVEVHSPGRPPNSVDGEAMRAGVHVPRNPHIYSRVAASQLATRAGSGIRRIARLLREAGSAGPGIAISDAEVVLTLPRRRSSG